jgi:hypothetical protein
MDRSPRPRRSACAGLEPGSPSALLRPARELPLFFLHERPKLINLKLAQMQSARQHLCEGRCMRCCPLEPEADRLVFVPGDLFGRPQARSPHHDQQRGCHLRSWRLQPLHRRALGCSKVRLAAATAIARSASMAAIAHYMGLSTTRIRTRGQGSLLLLLSLDHLSPPTLLLYHPSLESLPTK